METNFFKLKPVHRVVKDFCNDHRKSIELYQKCYNFLKDFDKTDELVKQGKLDMSAAGMQFYRTIAHHLAQMQEIYTNTIISYYAFKAEAQKNPVVMDEFRKMPPDFKPVQERFEKLIDAYYTAIDDLKKHL